MYVTRRAEFSASHVCRLATLSEAENRQIYGDNANPNGHGHNYVVEVTVEGEPDSRTGMVINLKELKDIIEERIVQPMDHRFLNFEVEPFSRVVPTCENLAQEIWHRLDSGLQHSAARLARIRVFETTDLYVEISRSDLSQS